MKFKPRDKSFDGPSKYVRLKDGESIIGVLRGDIDEHYVKWVNGKTHDTTADDKDAKIRYRVNIVVYEDGKFVAKVFGFGPMLYDHFFELQKEMDLEKTKLKISRKGVDTNTSYLPVPLGLVDEKNLKAIAEVELNALGPKKPDSPPPGEFESEMPDFSEIPF